MSVWALILAAGKGERLSQASGGVAKQFFTYGGSPLYWKSVEQFAACPRVEGLVLVFPQGVISVEKDRFIALVKNYGLDLPYVVAHGGALRQNSVKNGLLSLPETCDQILVHDAARPFVSSAIINRVIDRLESGANAVIPVVPVVDTIKYIEQGKVRNTPDRSRLFSAQTPQGFKTKLLLESHIKAEEEEWVVTDDASLFERRGYEVYTVEGEASNIKITYAEDLKVLNQEAQSPSVVEFPVVGYGYDVHRYSVGESDKPVRPMKLGGALINNAPGIIAHSDGDVAIHALVDALLGCAGLGDIGLHFPDTDSRFENLNSKVFLDDTLEKIREANIKLVHVDITIIAQVPKIHPRRLEIKNNIATLLGMDPRYVNVKATTEEGLGFTGEGKGIKVVALVTALQPRPNA